MLAERALERLAEHQERIAAILRRGRAALACARDPEHARLAQMRWELMRVLRDYQLFKHLEIFDPVIRHGTAAQAARAGELKQRCLGLAATYTEHVRRWSLLGAIDGWPAYRTDAMAMVDQLHAHLAAELRDTAGLLAGVRRTRQP